MCVFSKQTNSQLKLLALFDFQVNIITSPLNFLKSTANLLVQNKISSHSLKKDRDEQKQSPHNTGKPFA